MLNELVDVFPAERVEDVEEIISVGYSAFWEFVGEKLHELTVLLHERPERHHRELVEQRYVNESHIGQLHQLLLATENLLEEVLVHARLARQVELH